ncbi:hypothetical protein VTO42DRAFT_2778 [Malbranchea cinnamomea]
MEHVSTLCAVGTVGIAAAGFALGCPDSQPQVSPTGRRRLSIFRGNHSRLSQSLDLSAHTLSRSLARTDDRFSSYPSSRNGTPLRTQQDVNANPSTPRVGPRPRRQTYVGPVSGSLGDTTNDDQRPPSPRRPSTSWISRLSTITSLHESSNPDSSRPSPSVTSHTVPFQSPHDAGPAPNKLVKRPASQRGFHHSYSKSSSGMQTTASFLRRPATSHQRSVAMRQRSSTDSGVLLGAPDIVHARDFISGPRDQSLGSSNDFWRPFFGFGRACLEKRSGRRVPTARYRNHSPRRLVPEPGQHPTLLLATSINQGSSNCKNSINGNNHWSTTSSASRELTGVRGPASHGQSTPTFSTLKQEWQHPFSIEDGNVCTSPLLSESAANELHRRPFSLPQERQASLATQAVPIKEAFRGNPLWQQRQHSSAESAWPQRPKTSPVVETNLKHFNLEQNDEKDAVRSSLRRVPSFLELRSGRRVQDGSRGSSKRQSISQLFGVQLQSSQVSSDASRPMANNERNQRHPSSTSGPSSSTFTGSDIDARVFTSGEEDDTDFQSDNAFDSFSTRVADSACPNRRGPPIETIFKTPPEQDWSDDIKMRVTSATGHTAQSQNTTPPKNRSLSRSANREYSDSLSFTWSVSTESGESAVSSRNIQIDGKARNGPCYRRNSEDSSQVAPQAGTTLNRAHSPATLGGRCEGDTQKSLFDWSEQFVCRDGRPSNMRPRTANGKQLLDMRSGRSSSRGPPSSLHLRSQSVPLSRDLSMSRESLKTSKFTTWGLGKKGVSEDWDGDFEFDDLERQDHSETVANNSLYADTQTVKVPKSIMERQESLHGQFSHVRELTVLVEELKRLRIRAKTLQILDGPTSKLWMEALGIVNLATSEEEEVEAEKREAEHGSFAEPQIPSPSTALDNFDLAWSFENPQSKFAGHFNPYNKRSPLTANLGVNTMPPLRTESSAKAKSVLDSLYQQRYAGNTTSDPTQKLPFDTQSLRDLVVRAGVVTRALKEVIRRAEGVCATDERDSHFDDPPFQTIFSRAPDDIRTSKPEDSKAF